MKRLVFLAALIFLFASASISFGEGEKGFKSDTQQMKQFDPTQSQERALEIQKKERERLKKERMKRLEEEKERKLDEAEGRFR